MKIFWAVALSLLVLLGITLAQVLRREDPLPAQARGILAQDPRFSRVTVTIAFDDIVVLEGRTRTVMDSWDARNAIWTAWKGTPRPSGVLNTSAPISRRTTPSRTSTSRSSRRSSSTRRAAPARQAARS